MIDEKKLIECLVYDMSCFETEDKKASQLYVRVDDMVRMINGQPKIGGWISCKERLPEDGVDVLVWFEYFRYGEYNRLFQTKGISYTYNGQWSGFVNGQSGWNQLRIIAWQPMPEDYQG